MPNTPQKPVSKKEAPSTQEKGEEMKEMGKKAFDSVGSSVKELEEKIMHLPIDRRMIFFVGIVILIAAFLGSFGTVVLALIGVGMMYIGFSGNNFLSSAFGEGKKSKSQKK